MGIHLKWSKTLQTGENSAIIPVAALPRATIDPVRHYKKMCELIPTHPKGPVFVFPDGKILTYSLLRQKFMSVLKVLGINGRMTLHGLRAGAATTAKNLGAPSMYIKRHGTWSSQVYLRYLANS